MKTSELTGAALDWAVAKCEYDELAMKCIQYPQYTKFFPKVSPSTDWSQGGLIIEREKIGLDYYPDGGHEDGGEWFAACNAGEISSFGVTALVAAMRCYVASKLGEDVDVPEELK